MLKVPPLVARQSGANVLKTTLSRYQKEREDLVLPEIPRWDLVVVLHESREERARLSAEEVEKLVSFRPIVFLDRLPTKSQCLRSLGASRKRPPEEAAAVPRESSPTPNLEARWF